MYHNNIVGTIKIHLCPSHIGQVIRLPGSVSLDVLRIASLQVTLAVLEVVDTWVNSTPLDASRTRLRVTADS